MSDQRIERIERMVSDLVLSVGTLKAYFEEEREENQRRFEQIDRRLDKMDERLDKMDERMDKMDKRFDQMDKRFDEVLGELRSNKREHDYMASRLFRAEMELDNLKEQLAQT